jgi:hypothetical protein
VPFPSVSYFLNRASTRSLYHNVLEFLDRQCFVLSLSRYEIASAWIGQFVWFCLGPFGCFRVGNWLKTYPAGDRQHSVKTDHDTYSAK